MIKIAVQSANNSKNKNLCNFLFYASYHLFVLLRSNHNQLGKQIFYLTKNFRNIIIIFLFNKNIFGLLRIWVLVKFLK